MRAVILIVAAVAAACGSSSPGPSTDARATSSVEPRYHATVLPAEAASDDVDDDALEGMRAVVERELAHTGGVVGDAAPSLPRYVFRPSVGDVSAEPSGRTRATVTVMVESDGRVVAALRGTATAFVERNAPLADRQLAAIEGAVQGAFANLPTLVARLETR